MVETPKDTPTYYRCRNLATGIVEYVSFRSWLVWMMAPLSHADAVRLIDGWNRDGHGQYEYWLD